MKKRPTGHFLVRDTQSSDKGNIIELSDEVLSFEEDRGVSYWLRGIQMQVKPHGTFAREGQSPFYRRVPPTPCRRLHRQRGQLVAAPAGLTA